MSITFGIITAAVAATGLTLRGGFYPMPQDDVPQLGSGVPCRTLILLGNAGPTMWETFERSRLSDPDLQKKPDPLERWVTGVITKLSNRLGASPFYPFKGPPYLPFNRWALRAENVYLSPLGLLIHPNYGLWHAYRGALAFGTEIDIPTTERDTKNPCSVCIDRPCLSACPVSALLPGEYDVLACLDHITTAAGDDCRKESCLARRACPVGRDWEYGATQAAFHMDAFIRVQTG